MGASRSTAVVVDPRYRDHRGPPGHPERPDRLLAVGAAIDSRADRLEALAPREATPEEILRVHSREYLDVVTAACRSAPVHLDPDTFVSETSDLVARLAAGGTVDLVRRVACGEIRNGLAAVRPPGHHAERTHAMGFCLFNNVAVAARALQAEDRIERILILDWDVHHGNGTQHSFEDDPSVLYVSTHQFPFYPGTGGAGEAGVGAGAGATVNIPMPAGCGDSEYVGAFQRLLVPVARGFRPEMILVSCGFDAHRDDPLAAMNLSGAGFGAMTAIVGALAEDLCGGRLAFVLEGGYAESGLREGAGALFDALLDETPPPSPEPLAEGSPLAQIVAQVGDVHRSNFPKIGAA
jgi:acetoin utilization deacetylase AcuC-like enzyme